MFTNIGTKRQSCRQTEINAQSDAAPRAKRKRATSTLWPEPTERRWPAPLFLMTYSIQNTAVSRGGRGLSRCSRESLRMLSRYEGFSSVSLRASRKSSAVRWSLAHIPPHHLVRELGERRSDGLGYFLRQAGHQSSERHHYDPVFSRALHEGLKNGVIKHRGDRSGANPVTQTERGGDLNLLAEGSQGGRPPAVLHGAPQHVEGERSGMYQLLAERTTVTLCPLECSSRRITAMLTQWLPSSGTTKMLLPWQRLGPCSRRLRAEMLKTTAVLLTALSLLLQGPSRCHGSSILVVPLDGSHWVNMAVILRELHSRGHSVTVVRSAKSWYIPERSPYYTAVRGRTLEDEIEPSFYLDMLRRTMEHRRWPAALRSFRQQIEITSTLSLGHGICARAVASMLDDPVLMKKLQDAKYDLMLTDPGLPIGFLLGTYLRLPMVFSTRWANTGDGHFTTNPPRVSTYLRATPTLPPPPRVSTYPRATPTLPPPPRVSTYLEATPPPCRIFHHPFRMMEMMEGVDLVFSSLAIWHQEHGAQQQAYMQSLHTES
ncbi:hypothetical protein CRUP_035846 [Coryphaenoides rupestris]|nr:hypothetical protein CRUP_035846 [Coryphaenoides rupestris]